MMTELQAAHQRGLVSFPSTTTVGEWLDIWLGRRKPHVSVSTYEQYVFHSRHIPQQLRRLKLQELKRSHVRELVAKLVEKGLSASSRSKVLSHLRSALDAALEEELLVVNPAQGVRAVKTAAERSMRKRKALTIDELGAFLIAAEGDTLYPLFYTMFSLGLRRGEVLGLRWQDLNLDTGEVRVEQQVKLEANRAVVGPLKTVNSRRRLYSSPDLLDTLRGIQREQITAQLLAGLAWTQTDLVFTTGIGTPIHPRNVNRAIYAICDASGLRRFSSHTARHTHITQRLRNGEKLEIVSAVAGHATPSITIDIYRSVLEDEKRLAVFSLRDQLAPITPTKEKDQ
ncbi:site-specific integrase [Deinococcus aluminii]|uniref:Tyrosine recombinase XerC n=1 Tax=Deinococcus aluminii TaxID=1656885 RepID=A0ABP9XK92_9DEIO